MIEALVPPAFDGLIGAAERDITPPPGITVRNWGAARHVITAGNHGHFKLAALYLQEEDSDSAVVIIGFDGSWWRGGEEEKTLRQRVTRALGLDEARVLINLSHTHAGPSICLGDADCEGGHLVPPYMEHLYAMAEEAALAAKARAVAGSLEWNQGLCDLAQNRDLPDPAEDRFLVGFHPGTVADGNLLVGRAVSATGTLLATVVNYACHPTTLAWDNEYASPDFVGSMRTTVQSATGGVPCLFLQGFSGDLAPAEQYTGDLGLAEAHGRKLGFAVLSALPDWKPGTQLGYFGVQESGAPLALWRRAPRERQPKLEVRHSIVPLPIQPVATPLTHPERFEHLPPHVREAVTQRQERLRQFVGEGPTTPASVWVWRLGSMPLVAGQHEVYSRSTGLMRSAAGGPVLTLGLTNGGFGYLVPAEMYAQNRYVVRQTPFLQGALEQFEAAAAALLAG